MIKILDCTLRDGGYIVDWVFQKKNIIKLIDGLTKCGIDIIELGYLNKDIYDQERSIYKTIQQASSLIPKKHSKNTIYVAMADINQKTFGPDNLVPYKNGYIEGIRVVFYKHQVEEAIEMCRAVTKAGYKLFVQPMVTIDYSIKEYLSLIKRLSSLHPYSISIVDTFGYMHNEDIKYYFDILDKHLDKNCAIGFHSHNNMQLSVLNAHSLFEYKTKRTIIIDSSVYGMGRGAGNLNTELITNFYNENVEKKYKIGYIFNLIDNVVYPFYEKHKWGYNPYYFLTALHKCHPNYATFVLQKYKNISLKEFEEFLLYIPLEYRVKCKKDKTISLYEEYKKAN